MKQGKLMVTLVALPVLFAGCDIFKVDNQAAPNSQFTGAVVFNGQPLPVRVPTGSAQILLWQTDWDVGNPNRIESSIGVYLLQSGEFSAMLFDGEYEIELINNAGPWQNDPNPRSRTVSIRGDTHMDLQVQPYYTIAEESFSFTPDPDPRSVEEQEDLGIPVTYPTMTATFRVDQHVTTPLVDLVGVYVNTTTFVDRARWTSRVERTRANLPELATDGTITITVNLPKNIHVTQSPDRRDAVYVRVGVKPVGLGELAFTQVYKIDI